MKPLYTLFFEWGLSIGIKITAGAAADEKKWEKRILHKNFHFFRLLRRI